MSKELREDWLKEAGARVVNTILAPAGFDIHFESGEPLFSKVRFTCGWPSKGGLARKRKIIGECWSSENSAGNVSEIFISPTIHDPVRALDVMVHELGHAALGPRARHNKGFARFCQLVGLEGKPTATEAGQDLRTALSAIVEDIGPYPHYELKSLAKPKQTTRDRKAYCENLSCPSMEEDGFKLRLTKKWMQRYAVGELDEDGLPEYITLRCPDCGREMAVERAEDGE